MMSKRPAALTSVTILLLALATPAVAEPRMFVSAYVSDSLSLFSHPGGTYLGEVGPGGSLNGTQAARVGPDGYLYVANEEANDVVRYDRSSGAFVDVFVAVGAGGLDGPTGVTWGPDGDLFVASFNNDSVLRYDGASGASKGVFVASGSGGLNGPDAGTTFGPDGDLYVPSYWSNRVLKYDGASGAPLGIAASPVPRPRDLEFRPDGLLYVSSDTGSAVNRYDPGTGALVDVFVPSGSGGLDGAYAIEFDDLGSLFVASGRTNQVLRYDADTGAFIGVHVDGATHGIDFPTWVTIVREECYVSGLGLGPTNANRVRVEDPLGQATGVDFHAYGAGSWGTNVAAGDVSRSGQDRILTGPGPGDVLGPQVRGFQRDGAGMGKINYYAYGTLKYGVNVAATDLDADGFEEVLTGPGVGIVFGPHVRGWNFDGTAITAMAKINYFAYGTLKYGVNVAAGDLDRDGFGELLTGPGPGQVFGPQVRGWSYDGGPLSSMSKINFNAFALTEYGVNVAGGDVDADGFDEIACTPGPGPNAGFAPRFLGFDYDGGPLGASAGFDVTLPTGTLYGGRVGLGDVTGDVRADLLAGAGRDPAAGATVWQYGYTGSALSSGLTFDPFPGSTFGVNVAGATLDY